MTRAEIERIVETGAVLSGGATAEYAVQDVVPSLVAEPGTRDEAAALIVHARERGWSLVPYGGGTQMGMGFPPRKLDVAISTRRLNRVVDYQPDDMTVTVEPGLTLAELAETLAGRNQFLPLNPPFPHRATVGGTVAAGAAGPWRAGYGTPRDWVIGLRVVGADGLEVRAGGQVVKNVAGYDLPKLYTGSYGTLGLITEVTFKVMPRPPASGYALAVCPTAEAAEALLAAALGSDLLPAALELFSPGAAGHDFEGLGLLFQLMHAPEAVGWQQEHLRALGTAHGAMVSVPSNDEGDGLLARLRDLPAQMPFVCRVGTLSSRVARQLAAAEATCRASGVQPALTAHAATGQLFVCISGDVPEGLPAQLRQSAQSYGTSCLFPRLPAPLSAQIDPWGDAGLELRLMRSIKQSLDPTGVFNPGRFVGGI
jgi:glycolate oxidase FAD binding subunit